MELGGSGVAESDGGEGDEEEVEGGEVAPLRLPEPEDGRAHEHPGNRESQRDAHWQLMQLRLPRRRGAAPTGRARLFPPPTGPQPLAQVPEEHELPADGVPEAVEDDEDEGDPDDGVEHREDLPRLRCRHNRPVPNRGIDGGAVEDC